MKRCILVGLSVFATILGLVIGLPPAEKTNNPKVLDLTHTPTVPRESYARSVNLSFFVPAFSLFALASQFMPQMFPALTTTTTSRNSNGGRARRDTENSPEPDWLETIISNGLLY